MTSSTDTQRRLLRPTEKVLPGHARAHNRSMVLQHLFHSGPWSRADLARATGLTRVTVSDLVSSLMAEGLVTAHPAMPQIELEASEVASVIAWPESVSGTGGGGPN